MQLWSPLLKAKTRENDKVEIKIKTVSVQHSSVIRATASRYQRVSVLLRIQAKLLRSFCTNSHTAADCQYKLCKPQSPQAVTTKEKLVLSWPVWLNDVFLPIRGEARRQTRFSVCEWVSLWTPGRVMCAQRYAEYPALRSFYAKMQKIHLQYRDEFPPHSQGREWGSPLKGDRETGLVWAGMWVRWRQHCSRLSGYLMDRQWGWSCAGFSIWSQLEFELIGS